MDDDVQALTDHATALGRVRAAMSICQTIEMAEGCKPPFCAQAETCDLVFRYTALHGLVTERQSRLREELDRDDGYSTGYDDGYGAAQGEREDEI